MSLLGKLEPGVLQRILDGALQAKQDALLFLDAPEQSASIHIEDGQIARIVQQHAHLEPSLRDLESWAQGRFLLCRPDAPPAHRPSPSASGQIWILDSEPSRAQEIRTSLEEIGWTACLLVQPSHLLDLLEQTLPSALILSEDLASPNLLAVLRAKERFQSIGIVFLGSSPIVPRPLAIPLSEWHPLPFQSELLQTQLRTFLPASAQQVQRPGPTMDPGWLRILCELTPSPTADLRVQFNPNRWQELQQKQIPDSWRDWLSSLDSRQPLSHWMRRYPGDLKHARLTLHYLLQLGILERRELRSDQVEASQEIAAVPEEKAASPIPSNFAWLKVIVFGLRGKRKEECLSSLQQISQTQAQRVPRDGSVQIPYFPKAEYSRIPLRQDSLLVVYGALTEPAVDSLIEKIGVDLTSLLFFIDGENQDEVPYIRELRKKFLTRYNVPDLIMVSDQDGLQLPAIRQQLGLDPQTPLEPIRVLDLKTTYKILRKLLLKSVVLPA